MASTHILDDKPFLDFLPEESLPNRYMDLILQHGTAFLQQPTPN
jgi:hypothetical protein